MKCLLGKLAIVATLSLFMSVAGLQARPYSEQVRSTVTGLLNIPQVAQRLIWANGGMTLTELMTLIETLEPDTYRLLMSSAAARDVEENKAEYVLGLVIERELAGQVFALDTPTTSKYFWGEKPDIRAIVDEIVFSDRLSKNLQWDRGGLSNYRVIQHIEMSYPGVYELYVQSTDDKDDSWLRDIITGRIHSNKGKEKLGAIFTKRMRDYTGKQIYVYYKGIEEPSVETWLLSTIMHAPDLIAAMQADTGATMDEIVAAIRASNSRSIFYHLYTHAYKGSPILLGRAHSSASSSETPTAAGIKHDYRRRREHGLRSVLGRTMSEMESIVREKRGQQDLLSVC